MRGRGSGGVYDRYDMAIASQPACVHSPFKQTDCVSTLWCLCCSPDHLHLFVSATNPKSFDDAKGLCVNLIDTVRAEHAKMFPPRLPQASQLPAQPQPHISVPLNMPHSQGGCPVVSTTACRDSAGLHMWCCVPDLQAAPTNCLRRACSLCQLATWFTFVFAILACSRFCHY